MSVFLANVIIVIIVLLWIFTGNYKSKYLQIIGNKFILASIAFYCIHIVGLIWTEDLAWGLEILHKMWYFILLLPILFTIVDQKNIKYYISSFLLAISFTEVLSYLIWFEILPPFKVAMITEPVLSLVVHSGPNNPYVFTMVKNPTPFMSHISYNPILAFATYLVLHQIFFNKKLTNFVYSLYAFFAISMTINMFITGGRAGQVVFFVMLSILIFQVLDKQRIKSLVAIFIVIPTIFFGAYNTSDLFHKRVNLAINESISCSNWNYTSVCSRINYAKNSWQVIKENPMIGIGTGDFPIEYSKINQINSPELPNTTNPHNMYRLILMQLGLVGLFSMLSIFYYQIRLSFNSPTKIIRDAGVTLPLMFLVMMLSDSYLLGHYTTLMYIFFSSFLYKDFENA